jgi:predicted  nucleic acid-binding Zn-ribbon protein
MREIILIVLLLFSMSSFAADVDALKTERTTLREAMSALETEFDANTIEGERIAQKLNDLEWSATQVEKQVLDLRTNSDVLDAKLANHAADSQAIDVKLANHESSIQSHNGQCGGTFEDQRYVDWCNNNAASLKSARAVLDGELDSFNSEDATLIGEVEYYNQLALSIQEMIDNQATQEVIVDQEMRRYKAQRQELVDAGNKIQARLEEIQPYIDSCENAITSGDDEYMKAECGRMFDGNQ